MSNHRNPLDWLIRLAVAAVTLDLIGCLIAAL